MKFQFWCTVPWLYNLHPWQDQHISLERYVKGHHVWCRSNHLFHYKRHSKDFLGHHLRREEYMFDCIHINTNPLDKEHSLDLEKLHKISTTEWIKKVVLPKLKIIYFIIYIKGKWGQENQKVAKKLNTVWSIAIVPRGGPPLEFIKTQLEKGGACL